MSDNKQIPWYQRTRRWGQTNITELDPTRYDIEWWRAYWKRTHIQGVITNAGGIVAYYPSRFPLHYRAHHLGGRDLFGELTEAAHEDGLAVLARMDSNRTTKGFYELHPEWFTRDANGEPYQTGDIYITCIFSDYYEEFLSGILREIAEKYQPEGFTDNSWSGLSRERICRCESCARAFRDTQGTALPTAVDWDSPVYRAWIRWNYDRRLEIWDFFNKVTQSAGGPDCLWLGMNSGNVRTQSSRFQDHKALLERSEILMLDHQARVGMSGFQDNGDAGKLIHGLMGWEKLVPESMAQYQSRTPTFRLVSKPAPESHMWMAEGYAGGIQPWWHFISAYHEDRRQYRTPVPLLQWHAAHEEYLLNREPVASIGLVWSQENNDFYGRDNAKEQVEMPYYGMVQALIRARIPYLPIHADHIARAIASDGNQLTTLILPNMGALSDEQVQSVYDFVQAGGNLVVTGQSSLYDEWGMRRADFALADVLGVHTTDSQLGSRPLSGINWVDYSSHSYLRLSPELRAQVDGPKSGEEPPITGTRHETLAGFDETDIISFGGRLEVVQVDEEATVPLTLIPAFPIHPPEFVWMREPVTDYAALVLRTMVTGSRIAYFPADIDRLFAQQNQPDHGDLLANVVRWATQDQIPLRVDGPGFIDCHLYQQPGRMVLHLVNLTGTDQLPLHEHVPVGPFQVAVQLSDDVTGATASALVDQQQFAPVVEAGWVKFEVPSIVAYEVVVVV